MFFDSFIEAIAINSSRKALWLICQLEGILRVLSKPRCPWRTNERLGLRLGPMTSHSEDGMRILFGSCLHSSQMVHIIIPHTLSAYLIIPHSTSSYLRVGGELGSGGLKGLSGNGRCECVRAIGSVFCWQAGQRGGQMETEKCVGRNYRGHVSKNREQ